MLCKKHESSKDTAFTRRWVILSFLGTVLFLGVPMWYSTTTIHRAPLEHDQLSDHYALRKAMALIPIFLDTSNPRQRASPLFIRNTQFIINQKIHDMRDRNSPNWYLTLREGCVPGYYCAKIKVQDHKGPGSCQVSATSRDLDISLSPVIDINNAPNHPVEVANHLLDLFAHELSFFNNRDANSGFAPVNYAPQLHLTFSLLAQDGSTVSWDIAEALETYFEPLQKELARVVKFTIDTQVQFYSPLSTVPLAHNGTDYYTLSHGDLSTFVNFADWSLSSIHPYPTVNFILYVPSKEYSPLFIQNSSSNSFFIPQWGGVAIFNPKSTNGIIRNHIQPADLAPALDIFAAQLLTYLGTPPSTPNSNSPLFRIDGLARMSAYHALHTASDSLKSLYRVSQSLPGIAIPNSVLLSVNNALGAISVSAVSLRTANWDLAVHSAGVAVKYAQKAFFEKEMMMVQQRGGGFPQQHEVAVYLPLLGPVTLVVLMGLVRVIKEFRIK